MTTREYALSPQQRRLLARRPAPTPIVRCEVRLRGAPELDRLHAAVARVVTRHDALRTKVLDGPDGGMRQQVRDETSFGWGRIRPAGRRDEDAARRRAREQAAERVRSPDGPTLDVSLVGDGTDPLLLLTLPAVCADRESLALLVRDLGRAYRGEPLCDDGPQYPEYCEWQDELLREGADAHPNGAEPGLSGSPSPPLPFERLAEPGPADSVESTLDALLFDRLRALSGKLGVGADAIVLGAFLVALGRWADSDDVAVALGVDARRFEDLAETLGPMAASVPVRATLGDERPFADWVLTVAAVARGAEVALDEGDWPVPLHEDLVGFVRAAVPGPIEAGDVVLELVQTSGLGEGRKAQLVYHDAEQGARLELLFDAARLSRPAAERMLSQIVQLLRSAIEEPTTALGELRMISDEERALLVERWSRGRAPESFEPAHELFLRRSEREPERLALVAGDRRFSYGELAERARAVAGWLRRAGVEPNDTVATCVERSPELVIAQLAVGMAGGGFVALDPAQPAPRLQRMITDARPCALLFGGAGGVAAGLFDGLSLDLAEPPSGPSSPEAELPVAVAPDDLAYVIYTSGSTGAPKGVEIGHGALTNLARWSQRAFELGPEDRGSQLAAPGFDASIWEIWPCLISGASVWFAPEEVRSSAGDLLSWWAECGISVAFAPTPLAESLLAEAWPRCALRLLLTGGDKLRRGDWGSLPVELRNCYGPTECGVVATATRTRAELDADRIPPIGAPVDGARVFVLDDALRPVPVGVPGELCIGGRGLGRGYRNDVEATAAAFVPSPFREGERIYRTGDVARFREDGLLECLGRRDDQVKVRGFRIELGEIETVLATCPGVQEVAVVAVGGEGESKRLVAWLVGEAGADTLRSHVAQRLPDYMVPSRFETVEALPLTASGKLDRRVLASRELEREEHAEGSAAPETPEQEALAAIWCDILGLERVGVHDNFFELGGDSMLSVRVAARARQAGIPLTPRQMLERQTIAEQTALELRVTSVEDREEEPDGLHPLAPSQLWHFDLHRFDVNRYNTTVPLTTAAPVDPGALDAALARIVAHHEALRLRFSDGRDGWRQRAVQEERGSACLERDHAAMAPAVREEALRELLEEMHGSLDVEKGPLFRVACVRNGDSSPDLVLLVAHHLAADALSLQLLVDELAAGYETVLRTGASGALDPGPRYTQWARAVREAAAKGRFRDEAAHWLDVAPRELPVLPGSAGPRDSDGPSTGRVLAARAGSAQRLFSLGCEKLGVHPQELVVAAVGRACAGQAGADSAVLDLSVHGREPLEDEVDVSRCIGWFSGVAPVRLELGPTPTLADAAAEAAMRIRSMPGGGIGWQALRHLPPDGPAGRELRSRPGAELCVAYLGRLQGRPGREAAFRLAAGPRHPGRNPNAPCDYQLEVLVALQDDRLELEIAFDERRHRRESVQRLADTVLSDLTATGGESSDR